MRTIWTGLVLLCLAAVPVLAAEPGREAEIHLRTGTVLKCVILGYADGKFQVEESGVARSVPIDGVEKVVFGGAVGEHVRGPLDPPRFHEPTTTPAAARPEGEPGRPLHEQIRSLRPNQLIQHLWLVTGRFQDAKLLSATEAEVQKRLDANHEKGDADRNNRLALAIIEVAQKNLPGAKDILDQLRRDYPDDLVLRRLTPPVLAATVERWRSFDPAKLPRRGGPGLHPPRRPQPPEDDR